MRNQSSVSDADSHPGESDFNENWGYQGSQGLGRGSNRGLIFF